MISHLHIRTRLLLIAIVPVLLIASIMSWLTITTLQSNGDREIERIQEKLLDSYKQGLKHVVEAARSAIDATYNDPSLSEEEAKKQVRDIIRSIGFNGDNYVYLASYDYQNLAYRHNPSIEGPTKFANEAQKKYFDDMIAIAKRGGGFDTYTWRNPSTQQMEPKLSYTIPLEKWGWLMGAGVYITDVEQAVAAIRAQVKEEINTALTQQISISVLVAIIAAALGLFIGRSVTGPIDRASRIMQDIAEGDGDLTQRLPEAGRDELSELGRRFNAFVGKMQQAIIRVGDNTHQLASAAEELSQVAAETQDSVQRQGAETDQIASAIHEMAATIHQISLNASEVENAASDADRRARQGVETARSSQESVRELSDILRESAQSIESLAARSDEIQQVLAVIHSVTEQTNLLALNAAIEAARAGEHGRGFAVVADEVRQLARRSGESAEQIREMIESFVTESRQAVERMKSSQQQSERTVTRIDETVGALQAIEQVVATIHDQVMQIATASEQQSQVAEEINKNVARIVDASAQNSQGVSQTSDASRELARLGEDLRRLVGQFRVR